MRAACLLPLLLAASLAAAQDAAPEQRSTGLPSALKWTFNFDAGWGTFGFANSLYDNPKTHGVAERLSDQWFEGFVKPSLAGVLTRPNGSEFYGRVNAVGERTYGSVPPVIGEDVSSFSPDELYVGWRSGSRFGSENLIDLRAGRVPFEIGNGMLVYDGTVEGGSRGGYWTNARKAFRVGAVARLQPGPHRLEAFYLERDDLPEYETGTRLWGLSYEFRAGTGTGDEDDEAATTIGVTYLRLVAHQSLEPQRDGLNVFNARAYTAPFSAVPDLSFAFEYAAERNGQTLDSNAWTLQGAYEWSAVRAHPKLSYRYAFFEGDDPATPADERFDPLFPGFHDWGTWWQGEIAGEYFLENSNLISHQVRAHFTASDALGGGVIFYKFLLDHPTSLGPRVTSSDAAIEADVYTEWKINAAFTLTLVGAVAHPGTAVRQFSGRSSAFVYGMAYLAYAF